jgi:uncharacterized protein (TIGR02757 family)
MASAKTHTEKALPEIKKILDQYLHQSYNADFIPYDPISIPHQYTKPQDVEITAFWTSMISWGTRTSIIKNASTLFSLMDHTPYDFIMNHKPKDLKVFSNFKHRTFQYTDTLGFIAFLTKHYNTYTSLEDAFLINGVCTDIESSLTKFDKYFFEDNELVATRTQKHIASPARNSTCKRLNMFLRWMVRHDDKGVDFGLWGRIMPSQLMIPLDVHVERTSRQLGLLSRKQRDWSSVKEVTSWLCMLDPNDPIKYDYALFGISHDE